MNDKTIINTISKIHANIVSLLSFITLGCFLFFSALQQGLSVEKLILPGFKITQLYIKWNEKLVIDAESINVSFGNMGRHRADLSVIADTLETVRWIDDWIESVNIKKIQINDAVAAFRYKTDDKGYFSLTSDLFSLDSDLEVKEHRLIANVNRFSDTLRHVEVSGRCIIDLDTMTLSSKLYTNINNAAHLDVYIKADRRAIAFEAKAREPVSRIKPIVDLFALPSNITPWIVDYAAGERLHLHALKGSFPYSDPASLVHTLYAKGTYDGLAYSFHRSLAPIVTRATDIVFEKGVLSIYPHEGTFYAHSGGESWLNIDFNPKNPVLTANIRTNTRLDNDIRYLLDQYNIHLPFRQVIGTTDTELVLMVDLRTLEVDAKGAFSVEKGLFYYNDVELEIARSDMSLHNAEVTVKRLNVSYGDILTARASGTIDFKRHVGSLEIVSDSISLKTTKGPVAIDPETPLVLHYRIRPKHDRISVGETRWNFASEQIVLGGFDAPFDLQEYALTIPPTTLSVDGMAQTRFSGEINAVKKYANLNIDILALSYQGLELDQSDMPLELFYGKKTKIIAKAPSSWHINGMPLELGPVSLELQDGKLALSESTFFLNNTVKAQLRGVYDTINDDGLFSLANTSITNPAWGTLFSTDRRIDLGIVSRPDTLQITSESLGLHFNHESAAWKASFSDLKKIARYSDLLYDYNVTDGSFVIESADGGLPHRFSGKVRYPYPVLVKDAKPTHDYTFGGQYDANATHITINNDVSVDITDNTYRVSSARTGYNLGAILSFIEDHDTGQSELKKPPFSLDATDSFVYFTPDRRAIADRITLHNNEDGIYARLYHKKGSAIFEMHKGNFYLYGQDFGDSFMSHLLALAEYKGGSMSFQVGGSTKKTDGFVRVSDTIVKDYKVLNNVLAFVNTIPSLATFSVPHYSKEGIKVSNAYADFTYETGKVRVKGVKVDSHEIDIAGSGTVDYANNLLDMELNLITDLGSTLGKVPLVGYILMGEDGSIATTLEVTGTLDDPKVKTAIAKDIVVAPFNIIKRTLTFPFKLFKGSDKDEEDAADR